ncbi:hypothetical protein V8E53_003975 [Lactarius tabidus]
MNCLRLVMLMPTMGLTSAVNLRGVHDQKKQSYWYLVKYPLKLRLSAVGINVGRRSNEHTFALLVDFCATQVRAACPPTTRPRLEEIRDDHTQACLYILQCEVLRIDSESAMRAEGGRGVVTSSKLEERSQPG